MDKALIRSRFSRAMDSYGEFAGAQRDIADKMCRKICALPEFGHTGLSPADIGPVLEVGCGAGMFTRMLLSCFRPESLTLVDICPEARQAAGDILCREDIRPEFICGDAERCSLPDGMALVVSCSALQWFEDQAAFLHKCAGLLMDGGVLAISTFGPDNLKEIKALTGCGLQYRPLGWYCDVLEASGLQTVTAEEENMVLSFSSPAEVLRHLKNTGVTGIVRTAWTRGSLVSFSKRYYGLYGKRLSDGSVSAEVPLTYNPVYLIARKRPSLR